MTESEKVEMALTINENGDQAKCAALLAAGFPYAPKSEMADIINHCERQLIRMGFDNLNLLRKQLAVFHPSWRQ